MGEFHPLTQVLRDIEKHVATAGWDQPARLFALVDSHELWQSEPSVAESFGNEPPAPGSLSAVEQDGFELGDDLRQRFVHMMWGDSVSGCALVLERTMVPSDVEDELPRDVEAAARIVAQHPLKMDMRLVVGALRDGSHHALARLADKPDELLSGQDMVPGLTELLAQTLTD